MSKTFKKFLTDSELLSEMGTVSGDNDPSNHSREWDWNKFYKGNDRPKLLLQDIGSNHLKIYLAGNSHFFLTDENDNYKGQLEMTIEGRTGKIVSSNSKLERGFYVIMFSSIFAIRYVDKIYSDNDLSSSALNSYEKMCKSDRLSIQIINPRTNEIFPFSKEKYLENTNNIISVSEKNDNFLEERFDKYYERINKAELIEESILIPWSYRRSYLENSPSLDGYLFGDVRD